MARIPKYIIKDIEQISKYARRIEPLVTEVEDWYEKRIESYGDDVFDEISEDELNYISHNEADMKEFNLKAIIENLQSIESYLEDN